jgi:hypothetical protein
MCKQAPRWSVDRLSNDRVEDVKEINQRKCIANPGGEGVFWVARLESGAKMINCPLKKESIRNLFKLFRAEHSTKCLKSREIPTAGSSLLT